MNVPIRVLAAAFLAAASYGATPLHAQIARVTVAEENFRAAPNGARLAVVVRGTTLPAGAREDGWREVTLDGWVRAGSVRPENRDGHDLVVGAGGEALRSSPDGPVLARLLTGMLLTRVAQQGNWVRVRRTGWIWSASIEVAAVAPAAQPRPAPGAAAPGPAAGAAPAALERARAGARGVEVHDTAGGDAIARVRPLADLDVLARDGEWVRVRLEGWVRAPGLARAGDDDVLVDIPAAALAERPESFRGRLVEWEVQLIAIDRAEAIRADFREGEPYILARGPGDETGFVYIAVEPDRVEALRRLAPLQRIRVLARVRTARSRATGSPVLELVEVVTPAA